MTASSQAALGDRSLFPDLGDTIYLNHAAVSPPASPVRQAVLAMLDTYSRDGAAAVTHAVAQRQALKEGLGRLLGASAAELALVPSTTWGVTSIARGLSWKRGERVVLFEGEFPANVTPWQQAAQDYGLEVCFVRASTFAQDEAAGLRELDRALSKGARLCAVSFVQFRDGLRMPLRAIADRVHAAGGELFVDAIQGIGIVPLDVRAADVDYLACGAHKWLLALEGAGFLYVREGLAPALSPRLAGWLSHEQALDFLVRGTRSLRYDAPLRRDPGVFEVGSANALGFAALGASVALLEGLGIAAILQHVQAFHDALEPPLTALGLRSLRPPTPQQRSGTLSFELPDGQSVAPLAEKLRELGVACATPDGALRFSPHYTCSISQVPRVVQCVERALSLAGR